MLCRLCPSCSVMLYGNRCSCGYTEVRRFISVDDYFMCRTTDPKHSAYGLDFRLVEPYAQEYTDQILEEATKLVLLVNSLFTQLSETTGKDFEITLTSGWRPKRYSTELGLSTRSHHCFGRAVDIADVGNLKYDILAGHLDMLKGRGMAVEHKSATRTWLHLQSRLPRSGNTIFYP